MLETWYRDSKWKDSTHVPDLYAFCRVCDLLVIAILSNLWSLIPFHRGSNYCSDFLLLTPDGNSTFCLCNFFPTNHIKFFVQSQLQKNWKKLVGFRRIISYKGLLLLPQSLEREKYILGISKSKTLTF